MKRHEVSDQEWAILEPLLSQSKAKTGRPPRDRRLMLNGLLWILNTGAPWRDLPDRFGPWQTVYTYFKNWRAAGTFDAMLDALHLKLDRDGKIDWDLWCIDGTSIRATRAAAGASKKAAIFMPTSRKITPLVALGADSAANSISSSTVTARRWKSK